MSGVGNWCLGFGRARGGNQDEMVVWAGVGNQDYQVTNSQGARASVFRRSGVQASESVTSIGCQRLGDE